MNSVVSWVLSPVASGFCAALLYAVTKFAVLNHENSFFRAKVFFPLLVGFTTGLNVVLMILKGAKGKAEVSEAGKEEDHGKTISHRCSLLHAWRFCRSHSHSFIHSFIIL